MTKKKEFKNCSICGEQIFRIYLNGNIRWCHWDYWNNCWENHTCLHSVVDKAKKKKGGNK